MARKVQAASITAPVQARRQKPLHAQNGKGNGVQEHRKSKPTESAMPAAASPGRRTGRPPKTLDRSPNAKDAKPVKAPRQGKLPPATPAMKPSAAAQSAAQWDYATDTVRFDWPAIEQVASRDGPHQGTAKLLIAARAQGANSRWPL